MLKNNDSVKLFSVFILVLVLGSLCFEKSSTQVFGPPAEASEVTPKAELSIEDGQELFGRTCQQCHNSRGIGGKCPTLVRGAWAPDGANSNDYMFKVIHDGRNGTQMGAFGGIFTDEEIWAMIKYLRTESVRIQKEDAEQEDEENFDRR